MTREEAFKKMQAVKAYMISGNPIWNITEMGETFDMAIEALEQSERKKGKWTDDNACPFCRFHPWYERDIHTLSFCPNCGGDMRGEQE